MEQQRLKPTRSSLALLVGTDEMLLYTRQQILEKEGFEVSQVAPSRAVAHLHESTPDLVVACHTLSVPEAEELVTAARALSAPPALISFTKELHPLPTRLPFDGTVWSLASPESFIGTVHKLLRPRQADTSA